MTEEEKQAISKLREIIEYDKKHRLETIYDKEQIEFRNNIELVLDLIEKQKCELEINEANLKGYSRQVQKDDEKIEKLKKENEELKKNQRYKKDFNGDKIFSLEYDKETLRDMVLEKQEEIKELKSNSMPKDKIRDRLLVVKDLKSKIDLSKKETPVEFYVLDYVNNLLDELLEEE